MDVSIIIVSYNTCEFLKNCVRSIYENTHNIEYEIIVSDNGSGDGSVEMIRAAFPKVVLIENNENLGFGKANNRALKIAKGKYAFFLNSDTVLLNNAVKIFFDYFEENNREGRLGAIGANLLNPDMTVGESCHCVMGGGNNTYSDVLKDVFLYAARTWFIFFKTLFGYKLKKSPVKSAGEKTLGKVGAVTGADLFVKNDRNAFFDENYFMYLEDTDLQYRMRENKLDRILIDGPQIVHFGGASSKNIGYEVLDTAKFSMVNFFISRIYFCKKNISRGARLNALKILTLIIWLNPLIAKSTRKYIRKMLAV